MSKDHEKSALTCRTWQPRCAHGSRGIVEPAVQSHVAGRPKVVLLDCAGLLPGAARPNSSTDPSVKNGTNGGFERYDRMSFPVEPEPVGPGQESVWRYPRPALAQPTAAHIVIILGGIVIAETRRGVRTIETSHPPSYYVPPDDILADALVPVRGGSLCEWKGAAGYFDVQAGGLRRPRAAWSYANPTAPFASIRHFVAFYAGAMDACTVDGERVVPQPGGFYGGWITPQVAGPFKGVPGSASW